MAERLVSINAHYYYLLFTPRNSHSTLRASQPLSLVPLASWSSPGTPYLAEPCVLWKRDVFPPQVYLNFLGGPLISFKGKARHSEFHLQLLPSVDLPSSFPPCSCGPPPQCQLHFAPTCSICVCTFTMLFPTWNVTACLIDSQF